MSKEYFHTKGYFVSSTLAVRKCVMTVYSKPDMGGVKKAENTKHTKLIFEFVWGLIVSTLSVALSVYCFVKFTNEWFLLLGALSGSAAYAIVKTWLVLNKN